MNFRPELAAAVMAGEKTVTRRAVSVNPRSPWFYGRCALAVGRDYAICPGRGKVAIGRVRILAVERQPLLSSRLPGEAQREGFDSFEDFEEGEEADRLESEARRIDDETARIQEWT